MEKFVKKKEIEYKDKTTSNFFAPWIMYQDEYLDLGGMDPIFAPWPIEDSDFIERLFNLKYDIIQSWDSLVYHWCSRGHRFTEGVGVQYDTNYFKYLQNRNMRIFFDKWGKWPNPPAFTYTI